LGSVSWVGINFKGKFLTFRGPCIVIYFYDKSQQDALFLKLAFGKELYMFRIDLFSLIRSLNTVFTAAGICHSSYADCLLVELFAKIKLRNNASCWPLL